MTIAAVISMSGMQSRAEDFGEQPDEKQSYTGHAHADDTNIYFYC